MAYPAQLAFKTKQVADCLQRLGGVGAFEMRPIVPAPAITAIGTRWSSRSRARGGAERVVPVGRRLDGSRDGDDVVVGLHEADRYDSVLDVERCLLQSDRMNALLQEARAFFAERRLTAYDQESGEGLLRFLMLREGTHTGEAMVNVVTSAPAVSELEPLVGRVQARVPETSSVVLNVNPKKASVAVGVEEHLLGGRDHIRESLDGVVFQVSAGSFFQTNTAQAERLFDLVLRAAALDRLRDGGRSLLRHRRDQPAPRAPLSPRLRHRDGARRGGGRRCAMRPPTGSLNCTFLAGEVRFALPELLSRGVMADVVVCDPPRAGFHPKALARAGRPRAGADRLRVLQSRHARPRCR